jgi:hypothetical protein
LGPIRHSRGPAGRFRWAAFATAAILAAVGLPPAAQAAGPPVKATWATEVTATSFRANAVVNNEGVNATYHFDYLPIAAYEANVAAGHPGFEGASRIPIGAEAKAFGNVADQEIFQKIGGLASDTPYRYRLVIKGFGGETVGPERAVRTQELSPSNALAENRGWEMVSPIDKNGGDVIPPGALFGGGDLQAGNHAGSIAYSSPSSYVDAAGNPGASQYLSTRTSSSWENSNLTLPSEAGLFGPEPDGVPFRIFSTDLSRAVVLAEPHHLVVLSIPDEELLATLSQKDIRFAGGTPDLEHLIFSTCAKLTSDATEVPGGGGGCDPAFPNLYELSPPGSPTLVNLRPGDSHGTPGAALAAQSAAISTDGKRVYWVDNAGALYLRDGTRTLLVSAEGTFQTAAGDGSTAYYTKAGHLYRYSVATESSSDLTPGGGVAGVFGASADGSQVYFADGGGVELWNAGTTTPVAAAADPSGYPPTTGTARVSPDGRFLAFLSDLPLTDYDSNGENELFRYDASSEELVCVSCNPTGARATGAASIPGAEPNGEEVESYKPRIMDASGDRIFFDSADALTPKDTNQERDVYEWTANGVAGCGRPEGCIGLVSSGRGVDGATLIDSSPDGTDVFFLTDESLVLSDPGSTDLYDARIGGGFPEATAAIPCFGDACQPLPPEPEDPTPGTGFYGTEKNPHLHIEGGKKKHHKHKHHKHRHRKHHRHGKRGPHR